nr:hypothetical protein FJN17_12835 [Bradyrhizobium symbiodeficiens]
MERRRTRSGSLSRNHPTMAGSRPAHSGHIERGFLPTILTCLKPILVRVGIIVISDQHRRNSHATSNSCCGAVACSADLSRVGSDGI